ncbi:hypothetical protein Plhal304r1_c019g0067171 [Plasmopara halstedii]
MVVRQSLDRLTGLWHASLRKCKTLQVRLHMYSNDLICKAKGRVDFRKSKLPSDRFTDIDSDNSAEMLMIKQTWYTDHVTCLFGQRQVKTFVLETLWR